MKKFKNRSITGVVFTVLSMTALALFLAFSLATPVVEASPVKADSIPGDVNQDGNVDLLDLQPFQELLLNECEPTCESDIDQDGLLTLLDYCELINLITTGGG